MPRKRYNCQGAGIADDFNSFLKHSHLASNVGSVVLPGLGGFIGSFGGPVGTAVGAAIGHSGNEFIKSQGYGKGLGRRMRGGAEIVRLPANFGKGSKYPHPEEIPGGGRVNRKLAFQPSRQNTQLGGARYRTHQIRGGGIGFTSVFGTISNDNAVPKF